jgi:lipopolysaccharide transport system permease protein
MQETPVKIYTPRRQESFWKLFQEIGSGFLEGRELAWRLFVRDLKVSYSKSFLGIFWLFLPPLATAGIWIFLNNQDVVAIKDTPMAYAGFTMIGTMLWSMFAESITKPMQRYQSAMGMMVKLNFPREALVLAAVFDLIFSFFLKFIILIPVLWILGYPPTLSFIPAVLVVIGLMIAGLSIGLFLSPVGLLYGDIGKALPLILPFAMYLTPVIYPLREGGKLAELQGINPVTPFLERARSLMGGYGFDMNSELIIWGFVVMVLLLLGLVTIKIALPVIIERSGS